VTSRRRQFGKYFHDGATQLRATAHAAQDVVRDMRKNAADELDGRPNDVELGAILNSLDETQQMLDKVHYALSRLEEPAKRMAGRR